MINHRAVAAAAVILILVTGGTLTAQTIVDHPAPWFGEPGKVFYFDLNADGSRLFVNRTTGEGGEELVEVPTAGGDALVWFRNPQREIFDRVTVSGDGSALVFAKGNGSRVFVVRSPGAPANTVADVAPFKDPRQLVVSRNGQWAAFSAAGVEGGAPIGRVQAHLFVAATDGSVTHRITATPLTGRFLIFALSADGSTVVWVDDPTKGPIVANRDGTAPTRLPYPGARIAGVFCSANGSRVYCSTVEPNRSKLYSSPRQGPDWTLEHDAACGVFQVSPESGAIRFRAAPGGTCGGWRAVTGAETQTGMFSFGRPQYSGSVAFSEDGRVGVWRETFVTKVWRAAE